MESLSESLKVNFSKGLVGRIKSKYLVEMILSHMGYYRYMRILWQSNKNLRKLVITNFSIYKKDNKSHYLSTKVNLALLDQLDD